MDSFQHSISVVIQEYRKSVIQSEAEVRSKLIVPMLEALGYPSKLRAEEFNVYGYAGREALRAKPADFILFKDKDFAKHRKDTQKNKKWVEDNSLLVAEAKKPDEMPKDLGQAKFYTMWTKAVAYIITDGERLCAYYYSQVSSDYEVVDAKVDDLLNIEVISKLRMLSFHSVLSQKNSALNCKEHIFLPDGLTALSGEEIQLLDKNACIGLPKHTINYMKYALGRNAEGLTEVELAGHFLNMTDAYLMNDLRYGIPEYMIDVPRNCFDASLFIDNNVMPFMKGHVTEFYWEDIARYYFGSEYIDVVLEYKNDTIGMFEMGFRVLDNSVSQRLTSFEIVRKCLWADTVTIIIDGLNDGRRDRFVLPAGHPGRLWTLKQHVQDLFNFWLAGMNKLKTIEEYYEIEFRLSLVEGTENLNTLYDSIDIVYDGIMLNENASFAMTGDMLDVEVIIEHPVIFEEDKDIPLDERVIQGYRFIPRRSAFLPCKIDFRGKVKTDILKFPLCVGYDAIRIV